MNYALFLEMLIKQFYMKYLYAIEGPLFWSDVSHFFCCTIKRASYLLPPCWQICISYNCVRFGRCQWTYDVTEYERHCGILLACVHICLKKCDLFTIIDTWPLSILWGPDSPLPPPKWRLALFGLWLSPWPSLSVSIQAPRSMLTARSAWWNGLMTMAESTSSRKKKGEKIPKKNFLITHSSYLYYKKKRSYFMMNSRITGLHGMGQKRAENHSFGMHRSSLAD